MEENGGMYLPFSLSLRCIPGSDPDIFTLRPGGIQSMHIPEPDLHMITLYQGTPMIELSGQNAPTGPVVSGT